MSDSRKIATWKAQPLPYCITRFDRTALRSVPIGKRRFATPAEALKAATAHDARHGTFAMVDYAGAFEAA